MKLKDLIGEIFKKEELFVFWFTLIFYFFLFLNPNNKTFVLFFFFYLFGLYFFLKNFKLSLLLAYLASWPFNIGKAYVFEFVSAIELNLPYHPYGLGPTVMISIKEIFLVMMFLVLIRDFVLVKRDVFRPDRISILLFLFFFSLVIASFMGSIHKEASLLISFYYVSPLIFYLYVRNLKIKIKTVFFDSMAIISATIFLEVILANLQFITRGLIGLSIEATESLPLDLSLEAVISDYRPIGTFLHPNSLADFLLVYLFIFLLSLFSSFKNLGKIYLFSFLAGFWTLLLTLSRSAWGSFIVSLLFFLFITEKIWRIRLVFKKELLKLLLLIIPIIIPLVIFFFIPRLVNTFYAFEIYGGGYTRVELIKEGWEIIKQYPLFGIGLGMDTFYFYQTALLKKGTIFSGFPESIHNGYLSLLVQGGIFPLMFFLIISFLIFQQLFKRIRSEKKMLNKMAYLTMFSGLLSIYLNSFLQTLPDLQNIVFLSMMYGLIGKQKEHEETFL